MKKKINKAEIFYIRLYLIYSYRYFFSCNLCAKVGNVHFSIRFKQKCYLQQIVGMTASLEVERAETTENAIDWIKTLMANMDAEELSVVRVHTKELSEHVIATEQGIK